MINTYVGNQQKFTNNFQFVKEYFDTITKYYRHWSYTNICCNYYSLDLENTVYDKEKLKNGAYELIGDLTGIRWRKILNYQINGVEALPTNPVTDERGVTNAEKITSCWLPNDHVISCHVHDFIMFSDLDTEDNYYLRNPPLFEVVNVEKSPDFDSSFQKVSLKISYIPKVDIEKQLNGLFYFFDYEKKIYPIDSSIILQTILDERKKCVCNSLFDDRSGLYFDKVTL